MVFDGLAGPKVDSVNSKELVCFCICILSCQYSALIPILFPFIIIIFYTVFVLIASLMLFSLLPKKKLPSSCPFFSHFGEFGMLLEVMGVEL